LIASNQAANRDPDVFPEPDKFDIYRTMDQDKNLAFGYGEHRCIAEALSYAELESVFCKSA
jgi:nitric oxide reductase